MNKPDSTVSKTHLRPVGGICRLPQWGVITARGADAKTFLHGQLSQDVLLLQPGQGRLAAYCNPQGRTLASLYLIVLNPEEILLVCDNSVLQSCLKRLSMFIVRAKVTLSETSQWRVYGCLRPWSKDSPVLGQHWSQDGAEYLALHSNQEWARSLLLAPANAQPETDQSLLPLWDWLTVCSGVASITATNTGQYIPQMLNYESVGAIDFKKGCYPGQEVVARSQFRGQVKRRAYLLGSDSAIEPNTEVFSDTQATDAVGTVVQVASNPNGNTNTSKTSQAPAFAAIACLRIEASKQATLYTDQGAAMRAMPMPYALLEDV